MLPDARNGIGPGERGGCDLPPTSLLGSSDGVGNCDFAGLLPSPLSGPSDGSGAREFRGPDLL
ncbi:hypothetical protein [Nocardia cyriacigeorgica]|uniref:Uncharacterized protein n=1 Tax=Nocardia cyriacigeorgica TaxID=135487 RepID=A0A4U8WAB7_9NOCA|nr:hypothetical protein [Nocardia cyriacigeorgica]VFA98718.1 Uncharacterised protein [Nocardia cyriacigeorgica]